MVYLNGNFSAATFNYNLLLDEVQFINQKGDTLTLGREPALLSALIGESTYLYNHSKGFLEVAADFTSFKLGKRQKLETAGTEKVGAYNQSTGSSSIQNISSILGNNGQMHKLELKGDMLFSKVATNYLINQNGDFIKANKANVLKCSPNIRKPLPTT